MYDTVVIGGAPPVLQRQFPQIKKAQKYYLSSASRNSAVS